MSTENRIKALASFLNLEKDEAEMIINNRENQFSFGQKEYWVLTEEEANKKAREEIENSLWAFQADFILRHNTNCSDMNNWEYDTALEALRHAQSHHAESLNGLVRCLISDLDEFVDDAICEDGRGHFIGWYDGDENEETIDGTTYYIYRTN